MCHSSKDAETLALSKMIDEATYTARQIETLMYGDYDQRIPVKIFTDSEPTLESVASTKQIERKSLRMTVQELKEKLMQGEVSLYQWISTTDMWSDGLTKEVDMADGLERMLKTGKCMLEDKEVNKVIYKDQEIRMLNIRNKVSKAEVESEGESDFQGRQIIT